MHILLFACRSTLELSFMMVNFIMTMQDSIFPHIREFVFLVGEHLAIVYTIFGNESNILFSSCENPMLG